jgi:hypothetical protein
MKSVLPLVHIVIDYLEVGILWEDLGLGVDRNRDRFKDDFALTECVKYFRG